MAPLRIQATLSVALIAITFALTATSCGSDAAKTADTTDAVAAAASTVTEKAAPPTTQELPASTASDEVSTAPPPEYPAINSDALGWLALSSCKQPKKGWWSCTNGDGTVLIREADTGADVWPSVRKRSDYNQFGSVLFDVDGGGVLYFPSAMGWPQLVEPGPYPGVSVVDVDVL